MELMDHKESYSDLLEANKKLEQELKLVQSKSSEKKIHELGLDFERFADLLPEMVYEVDLTGRDSVCQ